MYVNDERKAFVSRVLQTVQVVEPLRREALTSIGSHDVGAAGLNVTSGCIQSPSIRLLSSTSGLASPGG